jgi:hypothetical protein
MSEGAIADDLSAARKQRLDGMQAEQIQGTLRSVCNQMKQVRRTPHFVGHADKLLSQTFAAVDMIMRSWFPR